MPFQTENILSRFYEHMALPEINAQGAEKLSEARILIIGAGRTGIAAILYLAERGTGTIGIADFGKSEIPGPGNQTLSENGITAKLKTCLAADMVKKINPDCRVNIYNLQITPHNIADIISDYDIIIDCSDNYPTHFLAGDAAELLDIPLVSATAGGIYGQVSVFNYNNGPAYRSLSPEMPSATDTTNSRGETVPEHMHGIIGSVQACEAIKIATGEGEILSGKVLKADTENMCADIIEFSISEDYRPCGISGDYGFDCPTPVSLISPSDLKNELEHGQKVAIYDIRNAEDFNLFNVGGTNVKAEYLLNDPEIFPADCTIVTICDTGDESLAVAEYLQSDAGLSGIFSLEGGIRHWRETMV